MTTEADQEFDAAWDEMFGEEGAQAAPDAEQQETQVEAKDTQSTEGESQSTKGEETDTSTKDVPGGVPYKRFAQIAKERKAAKARNVELQATIDALKDKQAHSAQSTASDDDDVDDILREVLGEDYVGDTDTGNTLQARIEQLEGKQAEVQFADNLKATLAKYPGVDRDYLIKETLRTQGKYSLDELATARSEDAEISKAQALAEFFEANPDLADAYKAKHGQVDGKVKREAAPSLRNTATGQAAPTLDPKDGESNRDFLSRMWDTMGG